MDFGVPIMLEEYEATCLLVIYQENLGLLKKNTLINYTKKQNYQEVTAVPNNFRDEKITLLYSS